MFKVMSSKTFLDWFGFGMIETATILVFGQT